MNPQKTNDVLDLTLSIRKQGRIFNPCFVSAPGLGKTEITQAWAKSRGLKSVVLSLSTIDPPDFKGFPVVQTINGKQRLTFATPDFWPTEGSGIIILEEMNRAPTSVMQCVLSLTDARRGFDGYVLPEGWIVAGCINPEKDSYDVNTMDAALKDRFEFYNVEYNKKSFVSFMKDHNWDLSVIQFVESNQWTYKLPEEIGSTPGNMYISPRSLSKLNAIRKSNYLKEDELLHFSTILGSNVGKDFFSFVNDESPVMFTDLVDNQNRALAKLKRFSNPEDLKSGILSLTIKDIIENNSIENKLLCKVLEVLPVDLGMGLIEGLDFKRELKGVLLKDLCTEFPKLKKQFKDVLLYDKISEKQKEGNV